MQIHNNWECNNIFMCVYVHMHDMWEDMHVIVYTMKSETNFMQSLACLNGFTLQASSLLKHFLSP